MFSQDNKICVCSFSSRARVRFSFLGSLSRVFADDLHTAVAFAAMPNHGWTKLTTKNNDHNALKYTHSSVEHLL